jgi:hypothetical protein
MTTRLEHLTRLGQSVWIDWLSRDLITSGELSRLIADHAVTGVTTNPTIIERSLATGAYDRQIRDLLGYGLSAVDILTELSADDVTDAALHLLPVWEAARGGDGYVSWEVDPALADGVAPLPRRCNVPATPVGHARSAMQDRLRQTTLALADELGPRRCGSRGGLALRQIEAYWRAPLLSGSRASSCTCSNCGWWRDRDRDRRSVVALALDGGAPMSGRCKYAVLHRQRTDGSWCRAVDVFTPDVPRAARRNGKEEQ